MREATHVIIYIIMGYRSDCNTYRGISLLSIVGKVYDRIVINRLQLKPDSVYRES